MAKLYRFRARNWDGKKMSGTIQAESEEIAVRELMYQGLFALELRETRAPERPGMSFCGRRVRYGDIMVFTRQFASMVRYGLPLLESLRVLKSQAENQGLGQVLTGIMESVQRGLPLWQALSEHPSVFPRLYVQTVKAGETSGKLDSVLERLAVYLEKEHQIRAKVKSSLVYPCVLAVFTVAVVMFLTGFVVPVFAAVLSSSGASLPAPTRFLLPVAGLLRRHYLELLAVALSLTAALKMSEKTAVGIRIVERMAIELPIVGRLNLKMAWGRFARTLGLLIGSGVPVLVSLEVAAQAAGNRAFEEHVGTVLRGIERGGSMASALASSAAFEPMMVQMVKVGEETGALDRMLLKAAEYYEMETERAIDSLLSLFEPVLIIFMAVIVGLVVVSTLLPVFEMITVVK